MLDERRRTKSLFLLGRPTVFYNALLIDGTDRKEMRLTACGVYEIDMGTVYLLNASLMERKMMPSTPGITPIPFSQVSIQRPMHPAVSDLIRVLQYPYLLKIHLLTSNASSSLHKLQDITILTPYSAQLAAFSRRLVGTCLIWLLDKDVNALLDETLLGSETGYIFGFGKSQIFIEISFDPGIPQS